MRLLTLAAAALVLLLAAFPAAAQSDGTPSGLGLIERCNALSQLEADPALALDGEIRQNYGYCLGYMVGFVSGFAARDALGTASRFCPPANARIADFVAAIQGWMVKHPEGLEQSGAVVAVRAFQAAYPCPAEALEPNK
jgi:hypothetical protein